MRWEQFTVRCASPYCPIVTIWGGAHKTTFLQLERSQRAVLKTMLCNPFRYPTCQLYTDSKVLTVRQFFICRTILRKHSSVTYDLSTTTRWRWKDRVCTVEPHRTELYGRQYPIHSSCLYNVANKNIDIYGLSKFECKKIIQIWLQQLTYEQIEKLLITNIRHSCTYKHTHTHASTYTHLFRHAHLLTYTQ